MSHVTYKDITILCQSQLDRSIQITELVGFPEGVVSQKDKIEYLVHRLMPWLVKEQLKTVRRLAEELKNA